MYYGLSLAQNNWLVGPAFRSSSPWRTTLDGGITQNATLSNPFPDGITVPQGDKYGKLNMWGYSANNSWALSDDKFVNAEIYQWSFSFQRQISQDTLVEVAYSANRSTHLPFGFTNNRDILPESAMRTALRAARSCSMLTLSGFSAWQW